MKTVIIEWEPFVKRGEIIPKYNNAPVIMYGLGIAAALEPFKMIVAECSDPVCFIGGCLGLYRVGIGDREEGFKQVLNAGIAQVGFFVWPKIQTAIRMGLGG